MLLLAGRGIAAIVADGSEPGARDRANEAIYMVIIENWTTQASDDRLRCCEASLLPLRQPRHSSRLLDFAAAALVFLVLLCLVSPPARKVRATVSIDSVVNQRGCLVGMKMGLLQGTRAPPGRGLCCLGRMRQCASHDSQLSDVVTSIRRKCSRASSPHFMNSEAGIPKVCA